MELEAAKMIGAGLACSALIGAGIGIGNIFGNYVSGALRNPSAAPAQFTNVLIGACRSDRPVRSAHRADHPVRLIGNELAR
jgi:F-type H+-transporting ATPase subunit c